MASKKRTTKIVDALESLNKTDIYSLMLFTIYQLKDDPKYSTLSELCYVLDGDSLTKFLSFYGGLTITIPTLKDMRLILQALTLYQFVNVEEGSFDDGLKAISDEFPKEEVKNVYTRLLEILDRYEFKRD